MSEDGRGGRRRLLDDLEDIRTLLDAQEADRLRPSAVKPGEDPGSGFRPDAETGSSVDPGAPSPVIPVLDEVVHPIAGEAVRGEALLDAGALLARLFEDDDVRVRHLEVALDRLPADRGDSRLAGDLRRRLLELLAPRVDAVVDEFLAELRDPIRDALRESLVAALGAEEVAEEAPWTPRPETPHERTPDRD